MLTDTLKTFNLIKGDDEYVIFSWTCNCNKRVLQYLLKHIVKVSGHGNCTNMLCVATVLVKMYAARAILNVSYSKYLNKRSCFTCD